ncbi:uncharacterized protein LOC131669311 [Phymastichus coffea]|uniref:uncharacterized protein LOC131669311 n=1 Tax=Phymastichus coffea TaxID=108790 RepID=UPI00273A7C90|nr:uncharacterized protein LOC131669311 [Phymastichus coffea]
MERIVEDQEKIQLYHTELILHDVLYKIFEYLNRHDLNEVSRVCKSWYWAAKVEKAKRGPQIMILQAVGEFGTSGSTKIHPVGIDDFGNSLRIKPTIGIFFTDGKYAAPADCDSVPYEICTAHQWAQPEDCFYVAVEASAVYVDKDKIGGEKNVTAAVFFPALSNVNYVSAQTSSHCIVQYFDRRNSLLSEITEKLFVTESNHVCFIMFIYQWKDEPTFDNYHENFCNEILDTLKTRYTAGTYSLWGGAINDIYTRSADDRPWSFHSTSFCALSLSNSSVKSWSIAIDNNLPYLEIQLILADFKKQVCLKSSSIAFLIISTDENNYEESNIKIFKNVFPTINIITMFNNKNHAVFSVNSTVTETEPKLRHMNSYAFMILTYKL